MISLYEIRQLLQIERETVPTGSRGVETILSVVFLQGKYDFTLLPFDAQVVASMLKAEC